jgi:hypothetical protein
VVVTLLHFAKHPEKTHDKGVCRVLDVQNKFTVKKGYRVSGHDKASVVICIFFAMYFTHTAN